MRRMAREHHAAVAKAAAEGKAPREAEAEKSGVERIERGRAAERPVVAEAA